MDMSSLRCIAPFEGVALCAAVPLIFVELVGAVASRKTERREWKSAMAVWVGYCFA